MKNLFIDRFFTTFHFVQNVFIFIILSLSNNSIVRNWCSHHSEKDFFDVEMKLKFISQKFYCQIYQQSILPNSTRKSEFFHRKTLCYFLNSFN